MIDKLIKAIGGGGPIKENPPIYVSSANDPKYKMYQDSLSLHTNKAFNFNRNYNLLDKDKSLVKMNEEQAKSIVHLFDKDPRSRLVNMQQIVAPDDNFNMHVLYYPQRGRYDHPDGESVRNPIKKFKPDYFYVGTQGSNMDYVNNHNRYQARNIYPHYKRPVQPVLIRQELNTSSAQLKRPQPQPTVQKPIPSQSVIIDKPKQNVPLVNAIKYTQADERPTLVQSPANQPPSVPNVNGNWIKKEQLSNTSGSGGYNYYVNDQSGQTMTETQYNALQDKYNPKPIQYRTGGQQLEFTPQMKKAASSIASFLFGK